MSASLGEDDRIRLFPGEGQRFTRSGLERDRTTECTNRMSASMTALDLIQLCGGSRILRGFRW